ncbi:MAG: hypothetical protein N2450_07685 [bacterium]|nr:hypothetical protein [bacterium]
MKRFLLFFLFVIGFVWIGCGEDDTTNPTGPNITVPTPTLTATSTSIHLAWSAISGADSIFVERAQGASGGTFSRIAALAGSATSYHDMNVVPGTTYRYQLVVKAGSNTFTGNSANATTLQQARWQSDPDNEYDMTYRINPQPTDTDAALVVEFNPDRSGKLIKVDIMFGSWETGKTKTNVIVGFHTATSSGTPTPQPAFTKTIPAGQVIENTTGQYNWTTVNVSDQNRNITSGNKFFISVMPQFTDTTTTSTQQIAFSVENADPSSNPINAWILNDDNTMTDVNWDAGVAAVIEY